MSKKHDETQSEPAKNPLATPQAEAEAADKAPANSHGRVVLPPSSPAGSPAVAGTDEAEHGADGQLTRAGMVNLIRQGQSVVLGGRSYTREADLPTDDQITAFRAQHTKDIADQAAQNKR